MPSRYDASTKAKAVRLVREHRTDYSTEYTAITAVAGRLGMSPETLRLWIGQGEVDPGQAAGITTRESQEIRELKRKCGNSKRPWYFSRQRRFFARECGPRFR